MELDLKWMCWCRRRSFWEWRKFQPETLWW